MYKISRFSLYSIQQISNILSAKIVGETSNEIKHLLIDSRQLIDPLFTLFIALKSKRNDGHQYISQLINKGVQVFLVNYIPENLPNSKNICFIIVDDTLNALQLLAKNHREKFQIPIIGITGSNGKTIVKEWLYQLLKNDYNISRSPKSYNSQIGVPLSVWQLQKENTLGVFEAGISQKGEMLELNKIIQPTIGVFTSIGTAHDEGFTNPIEKLKEKFLLFSNCNSIVVNAMSFSEDEYAILNPSHIIISKKSNATLQILTTETINLFTKITAQYNKRIITIQIPFVDAASVENAITCWAVLLQLHISDEIISERMLALSPVAMRLELKMGNNNCVLINDFYNSDINALEIALHHLKHQNRGGKKIVILSDIEQSGKLCEDLYESVSKLLQKFEVDLLVGIGSEISSQKNKFSIPSFYFNNTQDFISKYKSSNDFQFHNSIILLKGARSFEFETISNVLQQKSHDTILEINLNNLIHNINFYKSQINKNVMVMCMVKATGYGSGSSEIAFTLQHHHINYLAVAYADEGVELRKAGIHLPIMVMNPEEASYDDIIEYQLEPEIYSIKVAKEYISAIQKRAISNPCPIHIKLDTGMHRLGFENFQILELCNLLKQESLLKIKSVFSHFVGSDDSLLDEFTNEQISLFTNMANSIEQQIGYSVIKHICNSGAITRFTNAHFNMVRLGIGMYGIGFSNIEKQNLLNISSLKTRISQIKHLKNNETVGYNRKGKIEKETKIATIPIGYADGFSRKLGNGNITVLVNNIPCKTIGNICMDMCMIDVTNVSCNEGDEVIVFNNVEQLMKISLAMDTIPYEVLTSISSRVKRVYVQE